MTPAARVLIFGGNGFIGRQLCLELSKHGLESIVADVVANAARESVYSDTSDFEGVIAVVNACRPDTVVNLAYVLGPETEADIHGSLRVNVMGMANVFQACAIRNVRRCIYASSITVYGNQSDWGERAVRETDHGLPSILYGWQKQLNEATARAYANNSQTQMIGLRISTVYGPTTNRRYVAPIARLVEAAATERAYECPVAASSESNLIHVEDVAQAITALVEADRPMHDVYNSGGEATTIAQIVGIAREVVPSLKVTFAVDALVSPHVSRVDSSLITSEFNLNRPTLRERITRWIKASKPGSE